MFSFVKFFQGYISSHYLAIQAKNGWFSPDLRKQEIITVMWKIGLFTRKLARRHATPLVVKYYNSSRTIPNLLKYRIADGVPAKKK
jgi:hypothetical protein